MIPNLVAYICSLKKEHALTLFSPFLFPFFFFFFSFSDPSTPSSTPPLMASSRHAPNLTPSGTSNSDASSRNTTIRRRLSPHLSSRHHTHLQIAFTSPFNLFFLFVLDLSHAEDFGGKWVLDLLFAPFVAFLLASIIWPKKVFSSTSCAFNYIHVWWV